MKYKAIFFDRDGTLTYFNPEKKAWRDSTIESWSGRPFELPYEKMMALFTLASEGKKPWYKTLEDERGFFRRYYRFLLIGEGITENLDERAELLFSELWCNGDRLLYPETVRVLKYFYDKGYKMGVISDTSPSLEYTLEQLDIAKYFTSFTASSLVGAGKPDPVIFNAALSAQDVFAKDCIFVDDTEREADGARTLGFTSFHLDRENRDQKRWTITNLEQLVDFAESCDKIKEIEDINHPDKEQAEYILSQNKSSWDAMSEWFLGVTALPTYGCRIPTENELNLFGDVNGKKVLDIGCGSGHSLLYQAKNGAAELWGLDLSENQIKTSEKLLSEYAPRLFVSPMEQNPGIPEGYFDIVQAIYSVGWTVDIQTTFDLVSSYLKKGGIFVFSWDHPFMHCVDLENEKLVFSGCYLNDELFTFEKRGETVSLYNRKLSAYINALAKAGLMAERLVEETDMETLKRESVFSSDYYSVCKAQKFPLSFVIKARKI